MINKLLKILFTTIGLFISCVASAHNHPAYYHGKDVTIINYKNWMRNIPGDVKINRLSIPGTHDSLSRFGGDSVATQSLNLMNQLNSGIRYLDVRCRHINNSFDIYHGFVFQHTNFDNVMQIVSKFLKEHPSETILMRIKKEYSDKNNTRNFLQTLTTYIKKYKKVFYQSNSIFATLNTTSLQDVRGKVVILNNSGYYYSASFYYPFAVIQDQYNLTTNWDLYSKWSKVKNFLNSANNSKSTDTNLYINYLSGSGGAFPYFVASGHSWHNTGSSRLITGKTTPFFDGWPDFPRVACWWKFCTIVFEGTNILTSNYIATHSIKFTGIVVADFPGSLLINNIININYKNIKYTKKYAKYLKLKGKRNYNLCMDVDIYDGITNNWQNVQMNQCGNNDSQLWRYDSTNKYIRNKQNLNQCLSTDGAYNGSNIFMYKCGGLPIKLQQWVIKEDVIKLAIYPDFVIDSYGMLPKTNIGLWRYHGGNNQKWTVK